MNQVNTSGESAKYILKEQFRVPRKVLEKMASASSSPVVSKRIVSQIKKNESESNFNIGSCDPESILGINDEPKSSIHNVARNVASMVRRFEQDPKLGDTKTRAGFKSSDPELVRLSSSQKLDSSNLPDYYNSAENLDAINGKTSPDENTGSSFGASDRRISRLRGGSAGNVISFRETRKNNSRWATDCNTAPVITTARKVTPAVKSLSSGIVARAKSALKVETETRNQLGLQLKSSKASIPPKSTIGNSSIRPNVNTGRYLTANKTNLKCGTVEKILTHTDDQQHTNTGKNFRFVRPNSASNGVLGGRKEDADNSTKSNFGSDKIIAERRLHRISSDNLLKESCLPHNQTVSNNEFSTTKSSNKFVQKAARKFSSLSKQNTRTDGINLKSVKPDKESISLKCTKIEKELDVDLELNTSCPNVVIEDHDGVSSIDEPLIQEFQNSCISNKHKNNTLTNSGNLDVSSHNVAYKSIDNLSTHVNVSSSVEVSPSNSPEPMDEELLSHSEGFMDEDDDDETCMNSYLCDISESIRNKNISNLTRVKRSESDDIVTLERRQAHVEIPVRRCESIDDTTGFNKNDRLSNYQVGKNGEVVLFPQNIKTMSSATIVTGPEDMTLSIGKTAHFRAHYFGNPEPEVVWTKGGRKIITDEQKRIHIRTYQGESILIVKELRTNDSGKYEILVENDVGGDAASASLGVEGPPDPPAGQPFVSDIDKDTSSLTLAWYGSTFDGGSAVTGYIVEMSTREINCGSVAPQFTDWEVTTSCCNSTSYIVKDLTENCEYVFRTKAKNIHGISEPSRVSDPVNIGNHKSLFCEQEDTTTQAKVLYVKDDEDDATFEAPFQHHVVTLQEGKIFRKKFEIYEELGRGRFGVVFKVRDKETQMHFAAKFVRCRKTEERQKVKDEISIMNSLDHRKLLQLAAAYESPKEIIMVMEYISGGELFEKVVADDFKLTERDCLLFMRQISDAIGYMHEKNIVHLDLKPENILCKSKTSHQIKIIDFGLTRKLQPNKEFRILFGTPEFVSPEVISYEPVSTTSDMWSVGVVCYVLLSGLSPFMGDSDAETFANISSMSYDFEDEAFDNISEEAKDFIRCLLNKEQCKRMTAVDSLKHQWLAQPVENDEKCWKVINTDKLKSFLMRRRWQKAAHAIRALGRFTSMGYGSDSKADSTSSITELSIQSANF